MWWSGMIIMILGEICNFAGASTLPPLLDCTNDPLAYAFVEAIVVVCYLYLLTPQPLTYHSDATRGTFRSSLRDHVVIFPQRETHVLWLGRMLPLYSMFANLPSGPTLIRA